MEDSFRKMKKIIDQYNAQASYEVSRRVDIQVRPRGSSRNVSLKQLYSRALVAKPSGQ